MQRSARSPGYCHHCHTGRCPVGITTQDPELQARLPAEAGARLVKNYLTVLALELQTLARACGKSHVLNLEPEDLVALTVEAAAMAQVPLAGTELDSRARDVLACARNERGKAMAKDLAKAAKDQGIKYFLISFVDLLGVLRAKLVPAAAIAEMQENGAGFAGFATWLDMTPAHPDMFAKPDPDEPDPAALAARGRLARGRSVDGRQGGRGQPARGAQAADRGRGQGRLADEDRRRVRVLPARRATARRWPTTAIPRRSPATTSRR